MTLQSIFDFIHLSGGVLGETPAYGLMDLMRPVGPAGGTVLVIGLVLLGVMAARGRGRRRG